MFPVLFHLSRRTFTLSSVASFSVVRTFFFSPTGRRSIRILRPGLRRDVASVSLLSCSFMTLRQYLLCCDEEKNQHSCSVPVQSDRQMDQLDKHSDAHVRINLDFFWRPYLTYDTRHSGSCCPQTGFKRGSCKHTRAQAEAHGGEFIRQRKARPESCIVLHGAVYSI